MHLKKVVSNFDSRPLLQCVQYHKDGSLYATDSHVAVRVSDFHDGQNEFLLKLQTMEIIDATHYPDVGRLIKVETINCEVEVHIGLFIKAIKPFIDKNSFVSSVKMTIKDKILTLTSGDSGDFKVELPLEDVEGEIEISANPEYVLQALEFMRDAALGMPSEKKKSTVNVKFGSPIRPFWFSLENYDYLVTPVRTC